MVRTMSGNAEKSRALAQPPAPPLSRTGGKEGEPAPAEKVPEIGGPAGPEPTRYGDWERKGRCIDF